MFRIINQDAPLSFLEQRISYAHSYVDNFHPFFESVPRFLHDEKTSSVVDNASIVHYPSTLGDMALREAICQRENRKYELNCSPKNLLITAGGLHALHLIFNLIGASSLKRAFCHIPIYGNIMKQLESQGYQISCFSLTQSGELAPDYYKNNHKIFDLIYVNIPNNPLGNIATQGALEELLEFCNKHSSRLVVDMVYDDFIGQNNKIINPLKLTQQWKNIFIVNSMSKNYGAPGVRIGWIVSSEDNINQLSGLLETEMIAVSGVSQSIALQLLQRGNLDLQNNVMTGMGYISKIKSQFSTLKLNNPAAGIQFIAEIAIGNVSDFIDYMLIEHKLLLASSDNYAGVDKAFVRIPAGYHINDIEKALNKLVAGLNVWREISL